MNYTLIYEFVLMTITAVSMGLVMMCSFVEKSVSKLRCFLFLATPKLIQLYAQYYIQNVDNSTTASLLMGMSTLFLDFALFFIVFNGTFQEVVVVIISCELASLPMSLFKGLVEKKFTPAGTEEIFIPGIKELVLTSLGYIVTVAVAIGIALILGKLLVKIKYDTKIFNIFGFIGMICYFVFEISVLAGDITLALNTGIIYRYLLMVLFWILFLVLMYIINDYFTKRKLRREIEVLNEEKARQFEYYNLVKSYNEEIRKIRHDMKGHLSAISTLVEEDEYDRTKDYISKLNENFEKIKRVNITGNVTADTVICDIMEKCESKNIKFTPKGFLPEKTGIDDVSLTCIITNILNNAYEACLRMGESAEKFINLDIRIAGGCVVLKCENSKNAREKISTENIRTTKKEKGHGYGMKILKDIVSEYNGVMEIDDKTGVFVIKILLAEEGIG